MRVEHVSSWAAVKPGESGWNALLARSRTAVPFLTWQFQTAWTRAFAADRLRLLGVQDSAGEWVGALPLFESPDEAGPVLRLVGGTDVADYLDVLAAAGREEEVWKALLPAVRALGPRSVDLRPVPTVSPTLALVPRLAEVAGLACRVTPEDRCPAIALPASWDAYLAQLSGKDRHELRRKLRRADGAGVRIDVTRTAAGVAAGMDAFLGLHRRSKVGKARFMDTRMEAFFREIAAALAGAGWAALWLLWLDERPVAALFCLEYAGVVGLYNSGFDPEARAYSPGVVLIARSIEDAIARGSRTYDFLRGDEPYKYGFGAVPSEVFRLTLEPA